MRGSISYQVNYLWQQIDGIGISKRKMRKESDIKGMNGHKISPLVHAFRTKDEFKRIGKELGNFAKSNFNVKDMQAINADIVFAYIIQKIDDGLAQKSLSSYISVLQKIRITCAKLPSNSYAHKTLFSQEDLKDLRTMIDKNTIKNVHKNRAYINPASFASSLPEKSKIAFQLQLEYGVRAQEAILIRAFQLRQKNKIEIQGKGGYTRLINIDKSLYNQIKKEIKRHGSYARDYQVYLEDLKNAVEKKGEKWNGTHGLRFNFAQRKMQEYTARFGHEKALEKVSFELGHHRKEITKYYL